MEKIRINRAPVNAGELGRLHENSVKAMSVLFTIPTLMTVFKVIDLDPDRLTVQLGHATSAQVGAWAVIALLTAYGTFRAVGYIIGAGMTSWSGYGLAVEPVLGTVALGLFWMVNFTGEVLVWGAFAVLAAMAARWAAGNLRGAPAVAGESKV